MIYSSNFVFRFFYSINVFISSKSREKPTKQCNLKIEIIENITNGQAKKDGMMVNVEEKIF